jgi:hypothetical protein
MSYAEPPITRSTTHKGIVIGSTPARRQVWLSADGKEENIFCVEIPKAHEGLITKLMESRNQHITITLTTEIRFEE